MSGPVQSIHCAVRYNHVWAILRGFLGILMPRWWLCGNV